MSDLIVFRDHCRAMADRASWAKLHRPPRARSPRCFERSHKACIWGWQSCRCSCHDQDRPKPPTDAERDLWTRLADEIDNYLAHPPTTTDADTADTMIEGLNL